MIANVGVENPEWVKGVDQPKKALDDEEQIPESDRRMSLGLIFVRGT